MGQHRCDRWSIFLVVLTVLAISAIAVGMSFARDTGQWGDQDAEIRSWFQHLMQPDNNVVSCCGAADAYFCDNISVENSKTYCSITDDREDAPLNRPHRDIGTKIEIPNNKLKWDEGNPTGHAVLFIGTNNVVYCFVQGSGI